MLLVTGLILIPFLLILSIIGYRNIRFYDKPHLVIYSVIVFALISEILLRLSAWYFKNNVVLYNIFNLVEFFFFYFFYYRLLGNSLSKITYALLLIVFFIFYFYEFYCNGIMAYSSYSYLYKNTVLVYLSVILFRKISNTPLYTLITDYSIFWINIAVLIYYSSTFFVFGLRKYAYYLNVLTDISVYIHVFFILVFYGLLSIGLWKVSKK